MKKKKKYYCLEVFTKSLTFFISLIYPMIGIERKKMEAQQNERKNFVRQIILSPVLRVFGIHMDNAYWRLSVTNSLVNIPFPQTNSWIHQSAIQFALSWALEIMENLLWFTFNSFLTYTYYGFTIIYLWCWISLFFFFFSFTCNHTTIVSLNYNTVSFPFKSEFTL